MEVWAMKNILTYSELIQLPTFEERLKYVQINSTVGYETFGSYRYLNQNFYKSHLWVKEIRPQIILRDKACDLAMDGYEIYDRIYIHHLNPVTIDDIVNLTDYAIDPEFLVCVSFSTHNLLHYMTDSSLIDLPKERSKDDMCPWKKG